MNKTKFNLMNFLIIQYIVTINLIKCEPIENYLLDSTAFQGELNWNKHAFGDSMELPGWKEQSFSQKNGDVWRVHFVCDISSSNPNNWLQLPFIYREDANRLNVKLEYTIRECKKYPGEIRSCKETFQLLYIEANNDSTSSPHNFDESNYKYLKTIAPNNVQSNQDSTMFSSLSTKSTTTKSNSDIFRTEVELPLQTKKKGVYLVFRDQGACVSLLSIKVYYTLCSSQISNLVIFPKTPTGSNVTDLIQRKGHCINNADSKNIPYAYCQTNGNWFITNNNDESNICQCRPGYYYSPSKIKCIECPQGTYKNESSNQVLCQTCPPNSWSIGKASKSCVCLNGFYRMNTSDLDTECVEYPPEPKNLTVYYLDQATIKLRWESIKNYAAEKVQYKIQCYKCQEKTYNFHKSYINISNTNSCFRKSQCENYIKYKPEKNEIFSNEMTLSSLDANSQYQIEIYAQHIDGLFKTRTIDIKVRTSLALSQYQITNITAYQFIELNQIMVMWTFDQESKLISSPISFDKFELRYWPKMNFKNANVLPIKAPARNFTLKNTNPNVISNTIYIFQLRVKMLEGWGPYSKPIESIRINNFYIRNNSTKSTSAMAQATIFPSTSHKIAYHFTEKNAESLTATVTIAISVSLCFVIFILFVLIYLSRNSRFSCLSTHLTKPVITGSSNSDCDSLDFAKRNVQMAYNPLGTGSAGTRSSGNSSPMWPPMNSTKTYIDPHTYEDPTKVVSLFAKELSPSNIIIESVIGGGEFGDVCKGCLKLNPWSNAIVAIKTLKGAATEQNRCDFLTEASIMAQFNDPNVVRLEGVVTQSHPLMIVTEYMENGSLDTFMRLNENKLPLLQIIKILGDVASGMRYLSEMNYIHRDLAARNILINKDLICKVADFGLSREIDNESLEYTTKGGKIPIRWTAPEACNFRKYSYASDVWSYGVLAWEVLTFGERPYWNWENTDVIKANKEQYRLPPPLNCPDFLYKLMLKCWQDDRILRPTFSEIVLMIDEFIHYTEIEIKKQPKIQELMPINPRSPSQIQLTPTRNFLASLGLDHYADTFEKCGLGNLSNCFQLENKDLSHSLMIHSQYDQKKILEELNRICIAYQNSLNTQESYISYNNRLFSESNQSLLDQSDNSLSETFQQTQINQQHQNQNQRNTSIFQLIRTNELNTNLKSIQNNNDLLVFPTTALGNGNENNLIASKNLSRGFLV